MVLRNHVCNDFRFNFNEWSGGGHDLHVVLSLLSTTPISANKQHWGRIISFTGQFRRSVSQQFGKVHDRTGYEKQCQGMPLPVSCYLLIKQWSSVPRSLMVKLLGIFVAEKSKLLTLPVRWYSVVIKRISFATKLNVGTDVIFALSHLTYIKCQFAREQIDSNHGDL